MLPPSRPAPGARQCSRQMLGHFPVFLCVDVLNAKPREYHDGRRRSEHSFLAQPRRSTTPVELRRVMEAVSRSCDRTSNNSGMKHFNMTVAIETEGALDWGWDSSLPKRCNRSRVAVKIVESSSDVGGLDQGRSRIDATYTSSGPSAVWLYQLTACRMTGSVPTDHRQVRLDERKGLPRRTAERPRRSLDRRLMRRPRRNSRLFQPRRSTTRSSACH